MRVRPVRLNATVAWLFILGSTCFVVGSIPAYVNAVGGWPDGVTYFVGSIFFTTASAGQLLQAQSPAMTDVDTTSQHLPGHLRWFAWLPHDRSWWAAATQLPGTVFFNVSTLAALAHNATVAETNRYVWRPDFYGSTLFLVASGFGIAAVAGSRALPWRIARLNMVGSVLFMASALASYVLPTGELVSTRVSVVGTLLGAACFLLGAALMLPAWRHAVEPAPASPTTSTRTVPQNVQPKETP
ncbi:MAG TPA: hypothetical protein VFJ28_07715 [Marmoricola sp.]|nr:hypothetical protein [Marmoricola sp.]